VEGTYAVEGLAFGCAEEWDRDADCDDTAKGDGVGRRRVDCTTVGGQPGRNSLGKMGACERRRRCLAPPHRRGWDMGHSGGLRTRRNDRRSVLCRARHGNRTYGRLMRPSGRVAVPASSLAPHEHLEHLEHLERGVVAPLEQPAARRGRGKGVTAGAGDIAEGVVVLERSHGRRRGRGR